MARQLTAHHEAQIERMIASGEYADGDEVIGEALRLLEARATCRSYAPCWPSARTRKPAVS